MRERHGMTGTVEYQAYVDAKRRCNSPKCTSYKRYGARGIKFRFESFEEFFMCLGPRPSKRHSLYRIKNNKHYEPGNVRWATFEEQTELAMYLSIRNIGRHK
jgi:hypothetical protein